MPKQAFCGVYRFTRICFSAGVKIFRDFCVVWGPNPNEAIQFQVGHRAKHCTTVDDINPALPRIRNIP